MGVCASVASIEQVTIAVTTADVVVVIDSVSDIIARIVGQDDDGHLQIYL